MNVPLETFSYKQYSNFPNNQIINDISIRLTALATPPPRIDHRYSYRRELKERVRVVIVNCSLRLLSIIARLRRAANNNGYIIL